MDSNKTKNTEPAYAPGTKVSWTTVNGPTSGIVKDYRGTDYLIGLDNDKYVIVNLESIIKND